VAEGILLRKDFKPNADYVKKITGGSAASAEGATV